MNSSYRISPYISDSHSSLVWKQIEPKLITILQKRRHEYLGSQLRLPLNQKWDTFKASAGSPCPTNVDVIKSPIVIDIFDEDPQLSDVTEETIASVMAAGPLIGETYRLNIKRDLFQLLEETRTHFAGLSRDPSMVPESEIDQTVLSATAMFVCSQWSCYNNRRQRDSHAFCDLLTHIQEWHHDSAWNISTVRYDLDTEKTATRVLEALGLPVDTSMKTLEEMGEFRCSCGHPGFSRPLSFTALVSTSTNFFFFLHYRSLS